MLSLKQEKLNGRLGLLLKCWVFSGLSELSYVMRTYWFTLYNKSASLAVTQVTVLTTITSDWNRLQHFLFLSLHFSICDRYHYRHYFWVLYLAVEQFWVLAISHWLGLAGICVYLVSFTFLSSSLRPCTSIQVLPSSHSFWIIASLMPLLLSPAGWSSAWSSISFRVSILY